MPRSVPVLTQKLIDATPAPKSGRLTLRDHDQKGLCLRISSSGVRSWSYEYRSPITGKNVRITLADGSLAAARIRARELRVRIDNGRDPALEDKQDLIARRAAHSRAVTVADALDLYEAAIVKPAVRAASRRARMASLRKAVAPFKDLNVADLSRAAIIIRLDEIQASRGPIARNRSQSEIRHWLGWLHSRGIVDRIELAFVRKEVREVARERVLTDAELTALLLHTGDQTPFSDIIRVLMHTGMRRGEAASLQPGDLDFDNATIRVRAEVSKTRQPRLIPMDEAIAPMLRKRAQRVEREQFIFGDGSDYQKPFAGWGKRVAALARAMPEGEKWSLHDIRRTVATRLHETGADVLTVEDLLGHVTGVRKGVAGTYNRAQTLERQRPALRAWAVRLATLAGEREPVRNVINLRKKPQ